MTNLEPAPADRLSFAAAEAEREVLGAVLTRNALFYCGPESLFPEFFSTSLHRLVFAEIKRLITAGVEATPFAVFDSLLNSGLLHVDDWHVIGDLTNMPVVCCPQSVESVSRRVREAARRARFIASVEAATQQQYDSAQALDDTIATLQRDLAGFDQPSAEQADRTGMQALESALIEIGARQAAGKAISGLPTGLPSLDRATGGWCGDYSIVAAWTGQGKSAFALGAALAAVKTGADVAYFSFSPQGVRQLGAGRTPRVASAPADGGRALQWARFRDHRQTTSRPNRSAARAVQWPLRVLGGAAIETWPACPIRQCSQVRTSGKCCGKPR